MNKNITLNIINTPRIMNRYLLFALLINFSLATAQTPCSGGMAGGYPCDGLTLQSSFTYAELGAANWSSAGK